MNRLNENKKVVDEGLKLYPNLIRTQCSDAESALTKEMEKLDRVLDSIDRFAIDNSNSGKAIDAVKAHLNEYKLVITAQKSACEGDIFDYRKFKEDVKSEILLGDEINAKYRYAAHMYNENMEKAERYMKIYESDISPCANHYLSQSRNYENLAQTYKMQATVWEEKGQELTEINELTADPISTSKALKAKVKSGLSALGRAFDGNTFKNCIGSEWINGINSDMKNMAQKMAIGNGDLEGKSDAEIARICKKPYADMTALEKMEWQNIENYIVNCNIDSQKKVDFINLVLKSCTFKKRKMPYSHLYEYALDNKIHKMKDLINENLSFNSSDTMVRNSAVWKYIIGDRLMYGTPKIGLRNIKNEYINIMKCIDVYVYEKKWMDTCNPHYVTASKRYTIFPLCDLSIEKKFSTLNRDYNAAKGDQEEVKMTESITEVAIRDLVGPADKLQTLIPYDIYNEYKKVKSLAKTQFDSAVLSEHLPKLDKKNLKAMVIERPQGYPSIEYVGDKSVDETVNNIKKIIRTEFKSINKGKTGEKKNK